MSEQLQNNPDTLQLQQNEALLAQSEIGLLLNDAYKEAQEHDPRLALMKIVPIEDPDEQRVAYASAQDRSESGKHEIHIRLNDVDEVLEYYTQVMNDHPEAIGKIAERLHLGDRPVTPQLMYVTSILHEMGHVSEHMDFEDNMDALRLRNKQEAMALPLGYHSLTTLLDASSELRQRVDQHWDELSAKHNVGSIEELAGVQSDAYRDLTSERNADLFAAKVFDTSPELFDQLLQPMADEVAMPQIDEEQVMADKINTVAGYLDQEGLDMDIQTQKFETSVKEHVQAIWDTALSEGRKQLNPQEMAQIKQLSEIVEKHRAFVNKFQKTDLPAVTPEALLAETNERNAQDFIDRYAKIAHERPLTDEEKQAYGNAKRFLGAKKTSDLLKREAANRELTSSEKQTYRESMQYMHDRLAA